MERRSWKGVPGIIHRYYSPDLFEPTISRTIRMVYQGEFSTWQVKLFTCPFPQNQLIILLNGFGLYWFVLSLQVLTQNLSSSVLGKRRFGLLVPISYFQLKNASSQKPHRYMNYLNWNKYPLNKTQILINQDKNNRLLLVLETKWNRFMHLLGLQN